MSLCIYLNPGYGTIVIETKDKIRSWISGLIFLLCMANPFAFVFATTYIDTTDNGTQNPANPNVNITNIFASQAAFFGLSSGSSSVTATSLRFVLTSQSLSATQADVTLNVYALDQNGEPAGNSLFSQTFQNVNVSGYVASGNQPDVVLRPSNLVISPGTNYAFAISSSVNLFAWSYSPPGSAPRLPLRVDLDMSPVAIGLGVVQLAMKRIFTRWVFSSMRFSTPWAERSQGLRVASR